jgi:hypothetical protein
MNTNPSQDFNEVLVSLGELKGKMDAILTAVQAQKALSDKHEDRLASLERWRAYMIGAAVASGAASGMLLDKVIG